MIFDMENETLPREELEKLQLRRLRSVCERVYANVPFYRHAFQNAGITPQDIRSLDDIKRLPFTTKQDMRDNYPFGLFAVPRDSIVRIHASSGTTGKSTVVGYTQRDIDNWADLGARCLVCAGMTAQDTLHNAYGYGLFTGGLGAHYAAERLGATVIPMSGGSTARQAIVLRDFAPTAVCCTPSYMLHLYDACVAGGIKPQELSLRVGLFGAEPWTEEMRADIESKFGIHAVNIYGLSEIMGPGVAMECVQAKKGMHIFEDHFYPEIIDPDTCEVLPAGSVGELVITTITKEGIPLIRYRTRDITSIDYTPCSCGRTHARLGRILGRSDDMLIIRGVNVFPQQIEALIIEMEDASPHYQIIVTRDGNLDNVEVQVEVADGIFSDTIKNLQQREQRIQKTIKQFLGISTKVRLVEPHTIKRSEGKAQRVLDLRK